MNSPFFTPKTLGSVLAGAGSMGGGGGAVYLYQMPKTGKDLLIKEGFVFLEKDEEYKGMFHDQKDDENWKNENDLKQANDGDVKNKTTQYCQKKLEEKLPNSSAAHYSTTKQKLISFCTTEGIKTVKGRLIQSNQKGKGIEDNEEDKGKAVFAIYRYNDDFINWLKADDASNSDLNQQSQPSKKYSKLKDACTKLLKKNGREIKDPKHFNYGSWGCVELGYTTIEEKIKKDDNGGSLKDQNASDWSEVKNKWAETPMVKEQVKKAQNPSSSSDDLTEDGLKELCKSEEGKGVKSKLSDDDSYQDKYLVIKAVCAANAGSSG